MAACRFLRLTALKAGPKYGFFRSCHHTSEYTKLLKILPETEITELSNGIKVATETTASPTATVGLWINSGSRFESEDTNGVGNFFEHVAFCGTNQRSRQDLEKQVMSMGAELHANTDREITSFFAKCLSRDIPKAVDILGDVMQNAKFEETEIEKQRQVILKELDEVETDLPKVTYDYLHLTAYQGTPLAKSVYGPSENIKKISKADIESYVKESLVGNRMILVCSGDVQHDDVVKLAEKHLSAIPSASTSSRFLPPCRFSGSDVRARDDWLPFAHVAIAVETCGMNNSDIYPLMIAKSAIGNWDKTLGSSGDSCNRLIQHIYKGEGCHSFDTFHLLYSDTGLWGCLFVVDKMSLDDFVYNLQDEWMRLCINFTEADLEIAKAKLRNNLLFSLEDATQSCDDIGKQLLYMNRRVPPAEIINNIEAVSLPRLKEVCSKYLYDRCPAVAAVGPVEGLTDYTRIRAGMYRLRF